DLLAVGTAVVEELHDRDVARGIAALGRLRVANELILMFGDLSACLRCLLLLRPGIAGPEGLDHDFGMGDQVVMNDLLDRLPIWGHRHLRGACRQFGGEQESAAEYRDPAVWHGGKHVCCGW